MIRLAVTFALFLFLAWVILDIWTYVANNYDNAGELAADIKSRGPKLGKTYDGNRIGTVGAGEHMYEVFWPSRVVNGTLTHQPYIAIHENGSWVADIQPKPESGTNYSSTDEVLRQAYMCLAGDSVVSG